LTLRRLRISTDTLWDRPLVIVCTIELRCARSLGLSAIQVLLACRADDSASMSALAWFAGKKIVCVLIQAIYLVVRVFPRPFGLARAGLPVLEAARH
jgi:hypothetical protein